MANTNTNIGKQSKILSTDIYQFSLDLLRKSFSFQDENLNIFLEKAVRITDINEIFNTKDQTINGSLIINAPNNILRDIIKNYSNVQNNSFNHINFTYNKHYEEKTDPSLPLNTELSRINKLIFGVDYEYNNFVKKYEDFLMEFRDIPETNLPNFYDIIDVSIRENEELLKINGSDLFENLEELIDVRRLNNGFETITSDSQLVTNVSPDGSTIKYINFDEYLKKYNFLSIQFPFNTKIKIKKEQKQKNNFSALLHEEGVYLPFLDFIANNNNQNTLVQKDKNESININTIKESQLGESFKSTFNASFKNQTVFFNELQETSLKKINNFGDILSGKEDYIEVLGYKIEKYDATQLNVPTLIQQFYIPNISDIETQYIDTQIFTHKNYLYKVKPLLFTFKYNYKYNNVIQGNGNVKLEYSYSPFGVVYELESNEFVDSFSNHKLLPINPDVEFIPYIGVANKIKINITPGNGEKIAKIEFINSDERTKIANLSLMQQLSMVPVGSDQLKYSSYLPIKQYQVFRTSIKPTSYLDFSNFLLKTIDVTDSYAVSFEDTLNSNTKYYYTFRSIDYQESLSLPTEIYEFELINDNGTIIPNISILNLDDSTNIKTDSKQMRTFLKIQPAVAQKVLKNISNTGVQLGINKESVWGKDFKIRIKSKQTGKILDFNIKFTYNTKS